MEYMNTDRAKTESAASFIECPNFVFRWSKYGASVWPVDYVVSNEQGRSIAIAHSFVRVFNGKVVKADAVFVRSVAIEKNAIAKLWYKGAWDRII